MTEYVNKGVETGLRGIAYTGRLDDEGLPEISWYGSTVDGITIRSIIGAMLYAMDWPTLGNDERAILIVSMGELVGGKPFQKAAVRRSL